MKKLFLLSLLLTAFCLSSFAGAVNNPQTVGVRRFDTETALLASTPDFVGQLAYANDTKNLWFGNAPSPTEWVPAGSGVFTRGSSYDATANDTPVFPASALPGAFHVHFNSVGVTLAIFVKNPGGGPSWLQMVAPVAAGP